MKITGTATVGHPVDSVYAALTDPAVLVRTLPGCQRLEQTGPDTYQATVAAGVASIKGLFDGGVRLADQCPPESLTLHASGAGTPGTVDAVAHVRLVPGPAGGTVIHYAADATVGGVLGGVGQRMLSGVARKTAAEFFAAVDREIAGVPPVSVATAVPAVTGDLPLAPADPVPPATSGAVPSAPSASVPAGAVPSAPSASAPSGPAGAGAQTVWTRPAPVRDPGQQRVKELTLAAVFGATIALLGVLLGAIVASW